MPGVELDVDVAALSAGDDAVTVVRVEHFLAYAGDADEDPAVDVAVRAYQVNDGGDLTPCDSHVAPAPLSPLTGGRGADAKRHGA